MKDPLLERGPHEVTLLLSEYANSITKPVSPCLLRSDSTVLIGETSGNKRECRSRVVVIRKR